MPRLAVEIRQSKEDSNKNTQIDRTRTLSDPYGLIWFNMV